MNCVNHPTQEAACQCSRCKAPICVECETKIGGLSVCVSCLASRREQLARIYLAETQRVSYAGGALSGLLAGLIFALLWSQLSVSLGYQLGPGAVILGGVVGFSVTVGAGGKRGQPLQRVSAALAVIGILFAHFLILLRTGAHSQPGPGELSHAMLVAAYAFPSYLGSLSPWEALFLVLGTFWAYWTPRARTVRD